MDSPYMLLDKVKPKICRPMSESEARLFGIDKLNIVRSELPAITHVDWVFTIEAGIGAAIEMGETVDGVRRSIPITGGSFAGPELKGEVVPGGADYQQTRPDGSTFIRAVYMIRTDDGALINVVNEGLIVPPGGAGNDGLYFRTSPRFTAPLGPYDWLNNGIFVSAIRMSGDKPNTVIIDVYRVG